MSVPVPTAEAINLLPPDAEEVVLLSRGILGIIAPHGEARQLSRLLAEAIVPAMTGFPFAGDAPPLAPAEFAPGLARRDAGFRTRIVQLVILLVLVLRPIPADVVDRADEFARQLGVDEGMLAVAREFATGSLGLAAIDFERNGYGAAWSETDEVALHVSSRLGAAWDPAVHDPALARRWQELEDLPAGTIGRRVADFYRARGFDYPGTPGSAPPLLAQHDWVHVLADYGTTVECELEVFAFIARANDDMRAFSLAGHGGLAVRDRLPPRRRRTVRVGHRTPLADRRGHPVGRRHAAGGHVHRQHRLPAHRLVLGRRSPPGGGPRPLRGRAQGARRRSSTDRSAPGSPGGSARSSGRRARPSPPAPGWPMTPSERAWRPEPASPTWPPVHPNRVPHRRRATRAWVNQRSKAADRGAWGGCRVTGSWRRKTSGTRQLGRIAAGLWVFSALFGMVAEVSVPAVPGSSHLSTVVIGGISILGGVGIWFVPWERWSRRMLLWLVPLAFAVIGLNLTLANGNAYLYAITFLIVYVWIGLAQPSGTGLWLTPLLIVGYVVPVLDLHGRESALGLASALYVVPCCVFVGEAVAWGMTLLRRSESALEESRERYMASFEEAPMGIAICSVEGILLRVNRSYAAIFGSTPDAMKGRLVLDLIHPDDRAATQANLGALLAGDVDSCTEEKRYLPADRPEVWVSVSSSCARDRSGRPLYVIAQIEDITERRALREQLAHAVVHDQLTGLPNRVMFMDRLEASLLRFAKGGRAVALMFLDLDRFKLINDGLGHDAGDRLLKRVGERLQGGLRTGDLLARFGGDEFTVLCEVDDADEALAIARRLKAGDGPSRGRDGGGAVRLAQHRDRPFDSGGDRGLDAAPAGRCGHVPGQGPRSRAHRPLQRR